MDRKQQMEIDGRGDAAVVSFKCPCFSDVEAIRQASTQIRHYLQEHAVQTMVFDFTGVKFFSSQVLGLLLEARGALQSHGGKVVVCALHPRLSRVFRVTSLDRIFSFYSDAQAAIDAS